MKGLITNIQKFSLHDGPGIRTTVFFKGCPLSCVWCQNPETIKPYNEILHITDTCINCGKCIEVCPRDCYSREDDILFISDNCDCCGICIFHCPVNACRWAAEEYSLDSLVDVIMKDKAFYDVSGGGVTLSGGEPLLQNIFVLELLKILKKNNINTAIDTSGNIERDVLNSILPFADIFLYDIKFIDDNLHKDFTGRSNKRILENFTYLCDANKKMIIRVPLVEGLTDTEKNITQIKNYLKNCKNVLKLELIPFNILIKQKYKMTGKTFSLAEIDPK